MAGECWNPAVGYEGVYEVSDMGRIKVLPRVVVSGMGRVESRDAALLRPFADSKGYKYVDLAQPAAGRSGKKRHAVHHLVLEAFNGPRPDGMECDHINHDPADNRAVNLRWISKAANLERRRFHRGTKCSWSKLTDEQVADIKERAVAGECRDGIAKRFNVSKSHISSIVCGRRRQAVEV
jgi:hypothetical protein